MRREERVDLVKAWFMLSLAFAILLREPHLARFESAKISFLVSFAFASVTVGTGFVLHELAHRFVARKLGFVAEFRAWDAGLLLALVMSFFGFIFAAPGAVVISGHVRRSESGIIAAAGPLANIVLALAFLPLLFVDSLSLLGWYGLSVNSLLAAFNLLPFLAFDGAKVLAWSKAAYVGLFFFSVFLVFLRELLSFFF